MDWHDYSEQMCTRNLFVVVQMTVKEKIKVPAKSSAREGTYQAQET
jgi:hypothetical protein